MINSKYFYLKVVIDYDLIVIVVCVLILKYLLYYFFDNFN